MEYLNWKRGAICKIIEHFFVLVGSLKQNSWRTPNNTRGFSCFSWKCTNASLSPPPLHQHTVSSNSHDWYNRNNIRVTVIYWNVGVVFESLKISDLPYEASGILLDFEYHRKNRIYWNILKITIFTNSIINKQSNYKNTTNDFVKKNARSNQTEKKTKNVS